eukprot:COSAG06_NODE_679_length_13142_cov_15.143832_4_plen_80_part_00
MAGILRNAGSDECRCHISTGQDREWTAALWPSRTKRGKTTAVIDCDEHTTARSSSRPYYNACRKRQPSPIVHPISPPKK